MKTPVDKSGAIDETPFRVSVNLERFFGDERSRCYVSVVGGRRVRWLQRRLRRLFALPRRVCLLLRGHLLPPDEPLALLRPDDSVDVIPSEIDWTITKDHKTKTVHTTISDKEETIHYKRTQHVDENEMDVSINDLVNMNDLCDAELSEVTIDKVEVNKKHTQDPQSQEMLMEVKKRALALLGDYEPEQSPNVSLDGPQRRARRRVRRRRPRVPPAINLAAAPSLAPDLASALGTAPAPTRAPALDLASALTAAPAPSPCPSPSPTRVAAHPRAAEDRPPSPLANVAPISFILSPRGEHDDTISTEQLPDLGELKQQPLTSFSFCGVDLTLPIVVRNNSVAPRVARIVHPLK